MENEYKVLDTGEEKVMGLEIKYKIGAYKKGISSSSRQEAVKYIIKELEKVIITDHSVYESRDFLFYINRKVEVIDTLKGKDKERYIFTLLRPFAKYSEIAKSDVFKNILKGENLQVLEEQICYFVGLVEEYAITLDAILLERGINLLWYQEMSGIYLIEERDKRDYIDYLGSEKLVQRYIDEALPKLEPQQAPEPTNTKPQQEELTEREKQYYEKAITQGMAIKTDSGYKWLYCSGSKVSLVYFLSKVFCPKGVEQIPFKRLNNLWGVSRLDSANDQLANAKKPQQWRQHIDNLF
ncbi:hypothetical protein [Hoylesella nanceiensis]|uniref:hypothetical protein n=1 Tax=Hoylesella nanceiensis TaxID=425941 RepID=UPI0028EA1CC7|nr:hypothetical protein [Hoylesella nanceiensis]